MSEVRHRKPTPTESADNDSINDHDQAEDQNQQRGAAERKRERQGITLTFLDILRVLVTLSISSLLLSYFLTNGESLLWGYRPWFTKLDQIKAAWQGKVLLTSEQLSLYNGTDPSLPIYLALNGTIFDVSASPRTYGPGGSYHNFAGVDATRGFVTGCFAEDRTGDLRGVEEMYIPLDDPDEVISSRERKRRREQEMREAKKKVRGEVEKWVKFYGTSQKYFQVGRVVGGENWDQGGKPELCERARKARPKRKTQKEGKGEGET